MTITNDSLKRLVKQQGGKVEGRAWVRPAPKLPAIIQIN
jgi:hypothetical protein